MKEFVTKYSIAYWIFIVALLVGAFIGTDGFQWYQWVMIVVAVLMAIWYFKNKVQG